MKCTAIASTLTAIYVLLTGSAFAADLPKWWTTPSRDCAPVKTRTYTALFDPGPTPGLHIDYGTFQAWPLTPDQVKLGFVGKRAADNTFIIIPNSIKARLESWVRFTRKHGKKHEVCASRIVVTFDPDFSGESVDQLTQVVKSAEPSAKFVRPLMQGVQIEWALPFLGYLNRFDPGPTFPLGGVVLVWDLDKRNDRILDEFLKIAVPPVRLPGIVLFRELYTGLQLSMSLSISGPDLLSNRVDINVDK